jgi:phosphate-selective porin OprO/OprP
MRGPPEIAGPRVGISPTWVAVVGLSALVMAGCASGPAAPGAGEFNASAARAQSESEPSQPPERSAPSSPKSDVGSSGSPTEPADPPKSPLDGAESAGDAKPKVELIGRIDIDTILVGQSPLNQAIVGPVPSVTGFRRARLGAQGTVGEQVNWKAEFDFAGGQVSFRDVYAGLDELPFIKRIRVGHMLEPFSLEVATSSNYFPFAERSSIVALDPAYNWGVGIFSYSPNERATLEAGIFRDGTSNSSGNDLSGQNDMAYDVRATCLPWYDRESNGRYLLMLGGAFSQRIPHNNTVVINQGPQSNLLPITENPGSPFSKSISIAANQQQLFNVETSLVLGSLAFQAEWSATRIDQIGGPPVFLNGFYVFGTWFLTGENRDYVPRDGDFGMIHVRSPFLRLWEDGSIARGPGAWELTARLSYTNFADPNIRPVDDLKVGNREWELTLGVNWYLNDHARLLFNYVYAEPIDPNFGASAAHAFFIRTAVFW